MNTDINNLKRELEDIGHALHELDELKKENARLSEMQQFMADVIRERGRETVDSVLDSIKKKLNSSHDCTEREGFPDFSNDWELLQMIVLEQKVSVASEPVDYGSVLKLLHQWIGYKVEPMTWACRKCVTVYLELVDDKEEDIVEALEKVLYKRALDAANKNEIVHSFIDFTMWAASEHFDAANTNEPLHSCGNFENDNKVEEEDETVWYGGTTCDLCNCKITGELFDGKLRDSFDWAVMCARCFSLRGEGVGWGRGQKYVEREDGRFVLTAGGRPEE